MWRIISEFRVHEILKTGQHPRMLELFLNQSKIDRNQRLLLDFYHHKLVERDRGRQILIINNKSIMKWSRLFRPATTKQDDTAAAPKTKKLQPVMGSLAQHHVSTNHLRGIKSSQCRCRALYDAKK